MRSGNCKSDALVFSCLYGYNYYQKTGSVSEGDADIRAVHVLSGTKVAIRPEVSLSKEAGTEKWRSFIEFPADLHRFLWPVDVVSLDNEEKQLGLAFPVRGLPKLKPFRTILYSDQLLDWRKDRIQTLISHLLEAFCSLHASGYAYHCFDLDRMYYNPEDLTVLLDFSLSMTKTFGQLRRTESVPSESVAIEMMPPWHSASKVCEMSLADDYYSITVMLFRLMTGRMPYQGRLMDGFGDMMNPLRDTDEGNHAAMFRHYLSNPIFIFDPGSNVNSIGLLSSEQKFTDRWESLPDRVQNMFRQALCQKNVEEVPERRRCYSPAKWLKALEQECFCGNTSGKREH